MCISMITHLQKLCNLLQLVLDVSCNCGYTRGYKFLVIAKDLYDIT